MIKLSYKLSLLNSHATLVLVLLGHENWENSHTNSRLLTLINSHATLVLVWPGHESWETLIQTLTCQLSSSFDRDGASPGTWYPGQTSIDNQARVYMGVFPNSRVLEREARSNENKSCMRVDENWEARVCTRVFLALVSCSNKNKSWMRELASESLHASFLIDAHVLVKLKLKFIEQKFIEIYFNFTEEMFPPHAWLETVCGVRPVLILGHPNSPPHFISSYKEIILCNMLVDCFQFLKRPSSARKWYSQCILLVQSCNTSKRPLTIIYTPMYPYSSCPAKTLSIPSTSQPPASWHVQPSRGNPVIRLAVQRFHVATALRQCRHHSDCAIPVDVARERDDL